jgi:hypothetical protein
MKRTFAAALFALLTVTAPTRAATITWELTDVVAATNPAITFTGYFDYDTVANAPNLGTTGAPNWNINEYQNGQLLFNFHPSGSNGATFVGSENAFDLRSSTQFGNLYLASAAGIDSPFAGQLSVIPLDPDASIFWYFAPFGTPVTGSLTEAVPLPAALPSHVRSQA